MDTYQVTIEVKADSPAAARLLVQQGGFAVKRVTRPRAGAGLTGPHPFVRASAVLDRPDGLDAEERRAYVRGYAAACMTHVKRHGIPQGDTLQELTTSTRAAEWERHPAAHRKGLTELAAYRERTATYLAGRSGTLALSA